MQIKLLENLVEELANLDARKIVEILVNKKDVNEFLIAKKMDMTINQVRNILYKLSAEGLVSFIRKKDKRKGWYIYYWTLSIEKSLIKIRESLLKKISELKRELQTRQTKRFYVCKQCNIEAGEETALEHGFTCNECAEVYELLDNEPAIKELKSKIIRTERELKTIVKELEEEVEKEVKKRARVAKKIAKKSNVKKKVIKKKGGKVFKKKPAKKIKSGKKAKSKITKTKKKIKKIKKK